MKTLRLLVHLILLSCALQTPLSAQLCDPQTPVFTVDLSSTPNGTWISPLTGRDGYCCSSGGSDKCIEFILTLHPGANGIRFGIASGAVPPGALYYQINCGPPVQVGDPICISGAGPHHITFCKPGNNSNTFSITSIPYPSLSGTEWVSQACTGTLATYGLETSTVTWSSVGNDPVYNSFLSCQSGCDSTTITPTGIFPPYIDYVVCGFVIGGCIPFYFCDTLRVNFVNDLSVQILPDNPVICYGSTDATLTANVQGGVAPYQFTWNQGSSGSSVSVGPGTYTVTLTDAMGCTTAVDSVVVSSYTVPISADAGAAMYLCYGSSQSVTLAGQITGATGGQWTASGTFSPSNTALNATYTPTAQEISSGSAVLMLVTTGNQGCPSDTDYTEITIAPEPDPVVIGSDSPCTYTFETYTVQNSVPATHSWSVTGGNISMMTSSSVTVHWTQSGTGYVSVTSTHPSGCSRTDSLEVNIVPSPEPVISGNTQYCQGSQAVFSIQSQPSNTIQWAVSGATIIGPTNTDSLHVLMSTLGTVSITVNETNQHGCFSSASVQVTVDEIPKPLIQGSEKLCEQTSAFYSVPFVQGHSYNWTVTGGSIVGFSVSNSIEVFWQQAGQGMVSCRQVAPSGCDSLTDFLVDIQAKPQPLISGTQLVCEHDDISYQTPLHAGNYQWNITGGVITGYPANNSVNVSWQGAGQGSISVQEESPDGCLNSYTLPVIIRAKPAAMITGNTTVCEDIPNLHYTSNLSGPFAHFWTATGGMITGGQGTSSLQVSWSYPGNYNLSLWVIDQQTGCDTVINFPVSVAVKPDVSVSTAGLTGCSPLNVNFVPGNLPVQGTTRWYFGDGTISQLPDPVHMYQHAGNYSVQLHVTSAEGCKDTAYAMVTVRPSPDADFELMHNEETVFADLSVILTQNNSVGGIAYAWDFGDNTGSNDFQPAHIYSAPGKYQVMLAVVNSYGCRDTTYSLIDVKLPEDLYIPNAFTPNGDNKNDHFSVGTNNITELRVNIFNRWGENIYEAEDVAFRWDGYYKGNPVEPGVYVYLIRAKGIHGREYDVTGSVTVVR